MKTLDRVWLLVVLCFLMGCAGAPQPGPVTEARAIVGTLEKFGDYFQ